MSGCSRLLPLLLLAFGGSSLWAEEPGTADGNSCQDPSYFWSNRPWFVEFLGGAYFASSLGPITPKFNYGPIDVRIGIVPFHDGNEGWCDRFQVLLDGMGAPIFESFGTVLGGPSLLLRLDLPSPKCQFVPYFQVGAGLTFTDAASVDRKQRAIGQTTEFLLQAQVGARLQLGEAFGVVLEGGIQHISNGGIAERNGGVNALGGAAGFIWTFR